MDPGHHTAFLLAILLCVFLLLLVVSAMFLCYWRGKCFNVKQGGSLIRLQGLRKDQATSMTSFPLNMIDPKPLTYAGSRTSTSVISMPTMVDQGCQKSTLVSSCLSLESQILDMSEEECLQTGCASDLVNKSTNETSRTEKISTINYILLSGSSMLGSVLEKSSAFGQKLKRRCSSMKSGLDPDILMVPMESPVQLSSSSAQQYRVASLPRKLSSFPMCENSNDQQFTWNTELLELNSHDGHVESLSVPTTLERRSHTSEENELNNQNLRKPFLQPKSWFVSFGNRPRSLGAQVGTQEINNVTSLDSGVDIIEVPVRQEYSSSERGYGTKQFCRSADQKMLKSPQKIKNKATVEHAIQMTEPYEENQELEITHQEAARKLNEGHYTRSLWQKREERPLLWVN
ncbi:uncharacterized protein O3C94_002998 [Discoglossus pictus]